MGMTEKESLINSVTMAMVENYNLPLKEVKAKITEIAQNYHITISDETFSGGNLTTEYLLKKFSDGKLAIGMSEKTINQYKIAAKKLEESVGKSLADIDGEDINKFLRTYGKTVSSVTLRAKYQLLSSVYNFLFNHKYIPYNPILYVDAPKATIIYKEPLSDLDVEKIKRSCEKLEGIESLRDMAIIQFFISTGCRVSELCNIKIKDVDFNNKICKVLGKGKKERPVIISDKAFYRLNLYLEQRKHKEENDPLFAHIRGEKEDFMTKDGMGKVIRKLRQITGIAKLTCHTFRRYYATELRKHGTPIQMIATSLGHANLNQINRYSLYDSQDMLQEIRNAL